MYDGQLDLTVNTGVCRSAPSVMEYEILKPINFCCPKLMSSWNEKWEADPKWNQLLEEVVTAETIISSIITNYPD